MNRLVRLIVAAFLLTVSFSSWADTAIVPDSEAVQHVGDNVTVEGVVSSVVTITLPRPGRNESDYPKRTFVVFGDPTLSSGTYLIGLIPEGTPLAGDHSLRSLEGKKIKISGRIELYHGYRPAEWDPGFPAIKVLSRSQITKE